MQYSEIKRLIDEDRTSRRKQLAAVGQRYYDGEHDIKDYTLFYYNNDGELCIDNTRSNQKIVHPFFQKLADELTPFILASDENIIRSDADGLQEHLDEYFDADFWAEMADTVTGAYVKGFDYMYAFKNQYEANKSRLAFQYADSMGVVEVRADETDDNCERYIYWRVARVGKENKEIIKIQVHTDKDILFLEQDGENGKIVKDKDQKINPRPNVVYNDPNTGKKYAASLGFIPFFRLDYNKRQTSGIKAIKALIDDYDLMNCGLSNNLQDFDHPIYAVKGFEGDNLDKLQLNLKTKKLIGVGENGGLDALTINIPYEARKTKMDEDKRNILYFGGGANPEALKDTSATTNLVVNAMYDGLTKKADKYKIQIKAFLKKICKVVIDEINAVNGTAYSVNDIYFVFPNNKLQNEQENAQNEKTKAETQQIKINIILSVAAYIQDEEALKQICEVLDVDYDELSAEIKANEPVSVEDAEKVLDDIPTDDEDGDGEKEGVDE